LNVGLGSGFFLVVDFVAFFVDFCETPADCFTFVRVLVVFLFGGVVVVVFPELFVVALFTEGFFTGCLDVGVGFFTLGLPGAVVFWRVEVVFELFSFAFGVVVIFFFGGIVNHLNPFLSFLSRTSICERNTFF